MKKKNTTIEKKKRGSKERSNSNSVFAVSALSLVSSLSSINVGEAACVNPTTASLGLSLNNPKPADLRKDTGCTHNAGTETYVDPPGIRDKVENVDVEPERERGEHERAHLYNSFEAEFSK